jgi:alpha-tubulin suppressor-like RCC1 family protein
LKLECVEPLSNFAFNFKLRRYSVVAASAGEEHTVAVTDAGLMYAWGGGRALFRVKGLGLRIYAGFRVQGLRVATG